MDKTERLLKELTEANGVAGYETEISAVVGKHLKKYGGTRTDKMGSIICEKEGSAKSPKIMLASHMDEIGFMVKHITDKGYIKFTPLGGWWDQVLLTQPVTIVTTKGNVLGVIGAKPPHLIPADERNKVVLKKNMYIDVGAVSKDEVEKIGIRIGDPIIPYSSFNLMSAPDSYMSKAFDDRVGCAVMISALEKLKKENHNNTVFAAATTQEEVGVRGARTAVEMIDPDVAFILESDIAGDVPGISAEESSTKLGGGPSLLLYDAGMIPNLKLRDMVIETAKKGKIPLQFTTMEGGATDGSVIHLHKYGVPTVVIGVPTRHIHSHHSIIRRVDFDNGVKLLVALIKRLNKTVMAGFM